MMQTLPILLRASWQGWRNSLRHASDSRRKKVAELVGFSVLIAALYLMGRATFGLLHERYGVANASTILQAVNTFMMLAVFMLIKDGMEGAIKQLYDAEDIPLLLSSPLAPATVFAFKLALIIASNLSSIAIWLLPPWVAFGQIFRLPWHFYLALIPACLCLLVVIISQMVIVMMLIVRFFSSGRLLAVLKILGVTIGVMAGLLLSVSFLVLDRAEGVAEFILTHLKIPVSSWYPHMWVAQMMISWLPGAETTPIRWGAQLLAASVSIPIFGVLVAAMVYARSWECAKTVATPAKRRRRAKTPGLGFRGKIRSLMVKDFLVFIRHRGRVTLIVMLTLILVVVVFGVSRGRGEPSMSLFSISTQVIFYSIMITFGLTWGGYKAEEKTWWLLKSGPVSPAALYASKYLVALVCSICYATLWLLIVLVLFGISANVWLPFLLTVVLIMSAANALNTAVGTLPWVAEISGTGEQMGRRPMLRMVTIFLALIANVVLIAVPFLLLEVFLESDAQMFTRTLSTGEQAVVAGVVLVLIGGGFGAYQLGKWALQKQL